MALIGSEYLWSRSVALLIDGYNLLHGTGLFGHGKGAGTLEASREALLSFLARAVESGELERTTVVFDSSDAPPGLPRTVRRQGMTIRFAVGYADADELLEELIAADHAPKKLTVVSSDHRVQRAARRRRAHTVDSHQWYFEMRQRLGRPDAGESDAKPEGPYSSEEMAAYMRAFQTPSEYEGGEEGLQVEPLSAGTLPMIGEEESKLRIEPAQTPADKPAKRRRRRRGKGASETQEKQINLDNPFPPGYAEDVVAEEGNG